MTITNESYLGTDSEYFTAHIFNARNSIDRQTIEVFEQQQVMNYESISFIISSDIISNLYYGIFETSSETMFTDSAEYDGTEYNISIIDIERSDSIYKILFEILDISNLACQIKLETEDS